MLIYFIFSEIHMTLIDVLTKRGFLYQCTDLDSLKNILENKKIKFYIGFDCTATSLHVGNLTQLMLMRLFQNYGHTPIILIGNGTSEIGDPTGKDSIRKMLTPQQIDENIEGIKHSIGKIINLSDAIVLRNKSWLKDIFYLDFLTSIGRKISVNKMMSMEIVKNRLANNLPLSFLEFNYMIIQGYDFCYLADKYDCVLQCGGSDQWGNIIFGVDMADKTLNKNIFGLTTPLLITSDGKKMGKTEKGAIWLNEDLLSAYDYFQYWRNMSDEDIIRFGKMFGELEEDEMLAISDINQRKEFVSYKITSICHGEELAQNALQNSKSIFSGNTESFPIYKVSEEYKNQTIFNLISEILKSRKEARRYFESGAIKINNEKFYDFDIIVNNLLNADNRLSISLGKKNHYSIVFTSN